MNIGIASGIDNHDLNGIKCFMLEKESSNPQIYLLIKSPILETSSMINTNNVRNNKQLVYWSTYFNNIKHIVIYPERQPSQDDRNFSHRNLCSMYSTECN